MKIHDFKKGRAFYMPSGRWRCTDVGSRAVVAIHLNQSDERNYNGPPYSILEHALDEDDQDGSVATLEEAIEEWGDDFVTALETVERSTVSDGTSEPREFVQPVAEEKFSREARSSVAETLAALRKKNKRLVYALIALNGLNALAWLYVALGTT